MIVDTHVHAGRWKPGTDDESYSFEDLIALAVAAGVDKIVQVQGAAGGWENEDSFAGMARDPDRVLGVIGRFDPLAPALEERIAAFKARPGAIGLRITSRTADTGRWIPDRMIDPFFAAAEKLDVPVQLFVPDELDALLATARRFPRLRLLIDHMGIRYWEGRDNTRIFDVWPAVTALASEPNVWTKVSYFPEATRDIEDFPYPTGRDYLQRLYESVGPDRLIWGSNFPPVERRCTYTQAVEFMRVHCDFLPAVDRDAIMGDNFLAEFAPA